MNFLKKIEAAKSSYTKKDYEGVLSLLQEMDKLIDRLKKEDNVYGDTWQNFADETKTKVTKRLIKMVKDDLKNLK